MKEATGELNMTVVTVVAIAAIAAFFYAFIWPSIQKNMILTSACNASGGGMDSSYSDTVNKKKVTCTGSGSCSYDGTTKSCQTNK